MNKKGFTLVEIVVVLAVISIISAITVSITAGTISHRSENEDRIAVSEINNIFFNEWGTESYAYPRTAADIKLIIGRNGYEWQSPSQNNAEYWFDLSDGKILLGKWQEDKIKFDNGKVVEFVPNEKIITADNFLPGFVYLGEKYRQYLDEFESLELNDPLEAAAKLGELLSNSEVPEFIRKSLRTLAEHSIFINNEKAMTFAGMANEGEGDEWYNFVPQDCATDMHTVAIFTEDKITVDLQLKKSYIKSLYIPSDISVEFTNSAFDDTWIQRVLINDDIEYDKLKNHLGKYEDDSFTLDVSVLRRYYPSELPEYDLETYSVKQYLNLYDSLKSSSNDFNSFYGDELRNSASIETLYGGFYRLRPADRRYVVKVREELYDHIITLNANKLELEELYDKVKTCTMPGDNELLLKGLVGSRDKYDLFWLSEICSTKRNLNALDEFDKLFDDFEVIGALSPVLNERMFVADKKGEGSVVLFGARNDEFKYDFKVRGAYENIDITGVKLGDSKTLTSNGDKLSGEYYGTLGKDGSGEIITPVYTAVGDKLHSSEKLIVSAVQSDVATEYNGNAIKLTKSDRDITVTVKVASYLDPSVFSLYEVPLKGNAVNIFSNNDFASAKKDKGLCFHSDINYSGQETLWVNKGFTVYGNGYTYTNTAKTPEAMSKAKQMGEFRFPAVVTAEGNIESLKIVAKVGNQLGIANRFEAVAYAEEAETRATLGALEWIDVIDGKISGDNWSGIKRRKKLFGGYKDIESYGPLTIVSKRLAAVRVYGSGSLKNCYVEGGQYGVHLVGYMGDLGGRNNLEDVWIKNSLTANIYISDNDGTKQNIAINNVRTYNESFMQAAFPILIEPKIVAVSTQKYNYTAVWGYGMSLKYCYSLLENLSVNVSNFYVYNTVTKDAFYQMLYDNILQNLKMITDRVRSVDKLIDYFKINTNDIVDRLGVSNTVNVPIYYGEQCFTQIYDQHYSFADTGNMKSVAGENGVYKRNGFANIIKGYNSSVRAAKGYAAAGTNEVALSCYIVNTNHGGIWSDPTILPL